jgi:LysM repeat protein
MAEETEDIGEVMDSYRRRRENMGNMVIYVLIGLAVVTGLALVVVWLSGDNGIAIPFLSSPTPLPTATFTITPTATVSNTPLPTQVSPTLTATPPCPAEYTIVSGDTLSSIAVKCKLDSFLPILAANPSIGNGANIQPGQKIKIPPPGTGVTPTDIPADLKVGAIIVIQVMPGDTILAVANRCHTTTDDIIASNSIKDRNKINAGDLLKCHWGWATPVPVRPTPTEGPSPTPSDTPTPAPTSTRAP